MTSSPAPSGPVLVLGGTGFIGSSVAERLSDAGADVIAVGRRPVPRDARYAGVVADLSVAGSVADCVRDAETVVCLVGYSDPVRRWRVDGDEVLARRLNVEVLSELVGSLGSRSEPPVVVLASSVAVGAPPLRGYAAHKAAAERVLADATVAGTVRGVRLRLPTVYGAGRGGAVLDGGMVASLARRALAGESLTLWAGGTVRRSLLEVTDAAEAFCAAVRHADALGAEPFDVAGTAASVREVATLVAAAAARHTGTTVPLLDVPAPPHAAVSDLRHVDVDSTALRRLTGWEPHVAVADGVTSLVDSLAADHQEE